MHDIEELSLPTQVLKHGSYSLFRNPKILKNNITGQGIYSLHLKIKHFISTYLVHFDGILDIKVNEL